MTANEALTELRKALEKELEETCTSVSIFINSQETKITTSHSTV